MIGAADPPDPAAERSRTIQPLPHYLRTFQHLAPTKERPVRPWRGRGRTWAGVSILALLALTVLRRPASDVPSTPEGADRAPATHIALAPSVPPGPGDAPTARVVERQGPKLIEKLLAEKLGTPVPPAAPAPQPAQQQVAAAPEPVPPPPAPKATVPPPAEEPAVVASAPPRLTSPLTQGTRPQTEVTAPKPEPPATKPVAKPESRPAKPQVATKPAPPVAKPQVATKPAPPAAKPQVATKPAPLAAKPQVATKPAPPVAKPQVATKPAPQVAKPQVATKPEPPAEEPQVATRAAPPAPAPVQVVEDRPVAVARMEVARPVDRAVERVVVEPVPAQPFAVARDPRAEAASAAPAEPPAVDVERVAALRTPPPARASGPSQDAVRGLLDRYAAAWRGHDVDTLRAIGQITNDGQASALRAYFANVGDLEVEVRVLDIRSEGDRATVRFTRRDRFRDPAGREIAKESPPIEKKVVTTPQGLRFAPAS